MSQRAFLFLLIITLLDFRELVAHLLLNQRHVSQVHSSTAESVIAESIQDLSPVFTCFDSFLILDLMAETTPAGKTTWREHVWVTLTMRHGVDNQFTGS